ncbi:hypothetical protein RND81_12G036400 [Saponaria officinalis]|uniref:Protein kinase domain-containing protein n=1 Tax=Saponaria officinalis TaxID=3572 RepID=A0AAW1H523_SAPOF
MPTFPFTTHSLTHSLTNNPPMSTLHTSFLIFFTLSSLISLTNSSPNESNILLSFKSSLFDPSNFLSSWSNFTHRCNFTGITCNNFPPFTVTSITLQSFNLSGEISSEICQLSGLTSLNLADNLFNHPFPLHLSTCQSLISLNLSSNLIWGNIPHQISQFDSIEVLDLSRNHMEGEIPESLGFLKQLKVLNLGSNFFSGELPRVFGNFTHMVNLDLSVNSFVGSEIPREIGQLGKLEQLLLQNSGFSGVIPETFINLLNLKVIDLSQNNLTGEIPKNFGDSLKKLESFHVSVNKLSGLFPNKICSQNSIITLDLHSNYFTGELPENISNCLSLERFQVQNNGYFGNFPSGLFSLPKILLIRGENNNFTGEIPAFISKSLHLEQVQIDNNSFTGVIPKSLGSVKTLYRFSASKNRFYGKLPPNFCDSPVMSIINLSQNLLSGEIPEVKKCRKLVSLSLASNGFTGEIPNSLGDLPVLTYLDLSDNNLTGSIPQDLQNLKLALFNVSYNRLSGSVPFPLLTGLPASYLQGNPDLCGPTFPKPCSNDGKMLRQSVTLTKLAYALISVAISVIILGVFVFFVFYRRFRKNPVTGVWQSVFFYPLRISEQDLVMAINDKTAVGNRGGTFGKVHIIGLPSGELVAVKKLVISGSQSYKSLKVEIKTLAKIRHKNIVKILGFCRTDDSIILIYEYLSKGSLGDVIGRPSFQMQWNVRLKIAIGVAQGLAYLHDDYSPNLLHRDLKSNNILLDADFEPKLTDFALDRVVGDSVFQSVLAFESPPSCYVAPECKYNRKASEKTDVYSFGVVLLELVTGRLAETSTSEESYLDIVKWVRRKINIADGPHLVLDPRIMNSSKDEMLGVLELGLECTSVMPEKRPSMADVVRALHTLGSNSSSRYLRLSSDGDSSSLPV